MTGILSYLQGYSVFCCVIFTLFLILILYLRLFSIRKILVFALMFYFGFFLIFCKIKNNDFLMPLAPMDASFSGRIVSIPDSVSNGKVKFFFEVESFNDKKIDKAKTLVTVNSVEDDSNKFNVGNKLKIKGRLRIPSCARYPATRTMVSPSRKVPIRIAM